MNKSVTKLELLTHDIKRLLYIARRHGKYRRLGARRYASEDSEYSMKGFDRYRCIFVRVPKTASQSVSVALFGNKAGGHRFLELYEKQYSAREFYGYFKFTFVRNPWDRVVSVYSAHTGSRDPATRAWNTKYARQYPNFEEFVKGWLREENLSQSLQHYWPQYWFLQNSRKEIEMDFIGKFERLNEDFSLVARRLGINSQLEHRNRSVAREKKDYRAYYNDETAEIVADLYARDIELFNYSFDGAGD